MKSCGSHSVESEIEIELERTCRHLELTWRWSGPKFDKKASSIKYIMKADVGGDYV